MTAVDRAGLEPAPGKRADAMPTHQALDAATVAPMAFRPQGGMHPGDPYSTDTTIAFSAFDFARPHVTGRHIGRARLAAG